MNPVSTDDFEKLLDEAIAALPEDMVNMIDNVSIQVVDDNVDGDLGLYEGTPLTERFDYGGMALPDVVTLYRLPLCDFVDDLDHLRDEINITLVHELAHHLGIDDERLHQLGWA